MASLVEMADKLIVELLRLTNESSGRGLAFLSTSDACHNIGIDDHDLIERLTDYLENKGFVKVSMRANELVGAFIDITAEGQVYAERLINKQVVPTKDQQQIANTRKVFVVHGRNGKIRQSMFEFLRSIGLRPIEWSQAVALTGKPSPYVGEILDAAFGHAQAVVVLLTGDDEAKLRNEHLNEYDDNHERNLTPQARPNVLFEAGLAFGTHPERTVLVEIGKLRPFSDVAGRHVVRLRGTTEQRQELAMRLEQAGCEIDLSGTDWHSAGDFTLAQNP